MSIRFAICALLAVLVGVLAPRVAPAQQRAKVFIDNVQVGYTATAEEGEVADPRGRISLYKAGVWTPVYVYLRAGADGIAKGKVQVETTDSDDVQNVYAAPLPPGGLPPNEPYLATLYTKTGSVSNEFVVTVQADNKTAELKKMFDGLEPGYPLCLALGSRLTGLRQAMRPPAPAGNPADGYAMERIRVAYVDDVRQLTPRWFGYAGADLIVLTTGTVKFVNELSSDDKNRKEALAEWVRRGGRLIVSCGRNRAEVAKLFENLQMPLPVTMSGALPLASLEGLRDWDLGQPPLKSAPPPNDAQPVALMEEGVKLERKPGQEIEQLLPVSSKATGSPLVVRWPHGMGQVILVAFDLDTAPFTGWAKQTEFWKKLVARAGLKPPADSTAAVAPLNRRSDPSVERDDLATKLRSDLDSFKDVSVISFGWVALFILIYIVIVGPLDYLFLKKVVKRLELTWITFPVVVFLVSGGAYFTAYALKGNELRINKLDLIDIDTVTGRVYGNTWFTLFSPRIQLYTVGVEPASPDWAQPPTDGIPASGVVVSWMGKPDPTFGYGRARSQNLFRRTYDYDTDATGLTGVPIQVWSTKSFTASWERQFASGNARSRLVRQSEGGVSGDVANPLPVNLESAILIYVDGPNEANSQVHNLGTIGAGQSKPLASTKTPQTASQWLSPVDAGAFSSGQPLFMKQIMFHSGPSADSSRDTALYYLDQGWRHLPGGAILVGRIARQEGAAESLSQDPAMPSRLWLGELPSGPGSRPPVAGTLRQDTYVRVFLPVAAAPTKD
jgi:hypothetical protein